MPNNKIIAIELNQPLDTILHQVLNQALATIDAKAGSLMLVNNKQGILQIKARLGIPRLGRKTDPVYKITDNSIASKVVRNKRSYICHDIDEDPFFEASRSGNNFQSLLSIPIIHKDKVIAVINADANEKNHFTKDHQKTIETIAHKVATIIAERISILDGLSEIGVELTRLPREGGVELVLEKIAHSALRSLGADLITLYEYIQVKDEFPVEGHGPIIAGDFRDLRPMRRKIYPHDVPWTVVKERRSGFFSSVNQEDFLICEVDRPGDEPRLRFAEREGIKSMAALLLPYRAAELEDEEVVGVMFANYRTHHEFSLDEISALATFADYAAVAILNVRHEEQKHADQMKLLESISANFAHRMNNLAGTSRVATQIIRERIDPTDELANRQLDRIEQEAKILLNLAERLGRPFKETIRGLELAPIDIAQVLEEELSQIKPDLENIIVKLNLAPNMLKVRSVEFQLRQVIRDIISNAIEVLKEQENGRLKIRANFNTRTYCMEVEISDNGPGIPNNLCDRLFIPGVTTKKGKLGIGLWWCRTFMQATGGDVVLKHTKLGKGTTFVIEIPCANKDSIDSCKYIPSKDLLIVDDDRNWQNSLLDAIIHKHYSVKVVTDYTEASNALSKYSFKLAVVDIRLDEDGKNEDGLRLIADMDKNGLDTKAIVITGYGTENQERILKKNHRLLAFIRKKDFNLSNFRKLVQEGLKQDELS